MKMAANSGPIDENNRCSRCILYPSLRDKISPQPLTDKCIILDVDETLVHTDDGDTLRDMAHKHIFSHKPAPDGVELRDRIYMLRGKDIVEEKEWEGLDIGDHWGITRPYVKEFLAFCHSYFRVVAIWSAGQKKYVNGIVDVLSNNLPRPHIIFTRNDCKKRGDILIKPTADMAERAPELYMTPQNTIILDDRSTVFTTCNPANGIQIPEFRPSLTLSGLKNDELSLPQLMYWLSIPQVRYANDVRMLDKSGIFTTSIDDYKRSVCLPMAF